MSNLGRGAKQPVAAVLWLVTGALAFSESPWDRIEDGTRRYGLYIGHRNVGFLIVDTEQRDEGGLRITSHRTLSVGPISDAREETLLLSLQGEVVRFSYNQESRDGQNHRSVSGRIVRRGDGTYLWREDRDNHNNTTPTYREKQLEAIPPGTVSYDMAYSLIGTQTWEPKTVRAFHYLVPGALTVHSAEATYGEFLTIDHRGTQRPVTQVVVFALGPEVFSVAASYVARVDETGTVEVIDESRSDMPKIRVVAGNERTVWEDLPSDELDPDLVAVRAAAARFLRAYMQADIAELEVLIDYDALTQRMNVETSEVETMAVPEVRSLVIEAARQTSHRLPIDDRGEVDEFIEVAIGSMVARVSGDTGRVGPSDDDYTALHFHRDPQGVWRLVWWSEFLDRY